MPDSIPVHDCFWYRWALDLTQKEVAQQAGICTRTYASIEAGVTNPSTATLKRLAKVLKVSQRRLRGGVGAMSDNRWTAADVRRHLATSGRPLAPGSMALEEAPGPDCRMTAPALVLPTVLHEERTQSPFWPYRSRLEHRYATLLAQWHEGGMIVQWRYEAMRLKLAPRSTLTVDFWLTMAAGVGDGRPQLHETKGYAREDAMVKLKQAAVLYPEFRMFLVTLTNHQWRWQEIPAA